MGYRTVLLSRKQVCASHTWLGVKSLLPTKCACKTGLANNFFGRFNSYKKVIKDILLIIGKWWSLSFFITKHRALVLLFKNPAMSRRERAFCVRGAAVGRHHGKWGTSHPSHSANPWASVWDLCSRSRLTVYSDQLRYTMQ